MWPKGVLLKWVNKWGVPTQATKWCVLKRSPEWCIPKAGTGWCVSKAVERAWPSLLTTMMVQAA